MTSGYRWAVLFSAFYAFTAFAFALQLVPPLMGAIIYEFGISHTKAGLLMSMVVIPGIFLAIPAGMVVDRYGVKVVGSSSSMLVALGCLITATAASFEAALVGRIVLGVGGAFVVTAMPSIIPQWFPQDELGKAMGLYGINMPVASVVAFPLASALMSTYGWRLPFYIAAAIAASNIFTLMFLVKEGPLKHESESGPSLRKGLVNIELWKTGIVWLLFNAAAISFTTWSPKLFQDFKAADPVQASFLASVLMWAAMPCAPIFGWISDRIGRRRPFMIFGCALMSVAIAVVAYTSNGAMVASLVLLGVTAASVPPIVMALPTEILGPQLAGTGFGITTISLNMGIALAPPIIGLLIDKTGSHTLSFLGMALFSALGAVGAYTLKTK